MCNKSTRGNSCERKREHLCEVGMTVRGYIRMAQYMTLHEGLGKKEGNFLRYKKLRLQYSSIERLKRLIGRTSEESPIN
jgi:hypothetical protein